MKTLLAWAYRTVRKTKVMSLSIALISLLLAASVYATGLNVNSDVTFTPIGGSFRTTYDASGCPNGFMGKFTLSALLTNKPTSAAMPGLSIRVLILTSGNVLLDPQNNAILGGEGSVMQIPKTGQYADGLLGAGESVEVPFIVCLKAFDPFQFFVDVDGLVTQLVSINGIGINSGNGPSGTPTGTDRGLNTGGVSPLQGESNPTTATSADGRFVMFTSAASDLVKNDDNGKSDVFVRDLQTKMTTLVSINRSGTQSGNDASFSESMSPDGRFISFVSYATDLVEAPTFGAGEVFVRDLLTGTTTLVSVNLAGTGANEICPYWSRVDHHFLGALPCSSNSRISADGKTVAFLSFVDDLVPNKTFSNGEIFVRNLQTGTTTLASVNRSGTGRRDTCPISGLSPGPFDGLQPCSQGPVMSADGRFVAFFSYAKDLTSLETSGIGDIFLRDLQTENAILVSVNRSGTGGGNFFTFPDMTRISADGRFVAFASYASDLVAHDTNELPDIYVRDLQTGATTLVSINAAGNDGGGGRSLDPRLTPDGRYVAFTSYADDLVANDSNGFADVFMRDLVAGTTTLVSVDLSGTNGANASETQNPILSADGRHVAFESRATNLVAETDGNGPLESDVFIRDLLTGKTTVVSVNRLGFSTGQSGSILQALSSDGSLVVFLSAGSDLVPNDMNATHDLFVRPVR